MLSFLRVAELAIVDAVEVAFGPRLNVITGETGAGKSILVSALKLVLGGRARADLVRRGAREAEVEAQFVDHGLGERLVAMGFADDEELVIRRIVQGEGRSRAYVNGSLATASQLAELGRGLVDISSQHEHQSLVDPASHGHWLDAFARLGADVERVGDLHDALTAHLADLQGERARAAERATREDVLRWQIEEIERLDPQPGELDGLAEEVLRLKHASRLQAVSESGEDALYGGTGAVSARIQQVINGLSDAAHLDPALRGHADRLVAVRSDIDDIARELGRYARRVDGDPARLAEVEERLGALRRLLRKHPTLDAAIEHRNEAKRELGSLAAIDDRISALEADVQALSTEAARVADRLSAARREHADRLAAAIAIELTDLAMGGARVAIEVGASEGGVDLGGRRLGKRGFDRVEILVAPNRGEPPKPLGKVASGGELSRALLALKRVLAGLGGRGTWVFDEVDTGVGGAVGEVIGHKLGDIARHHQVICVTHLPQIAALADHHFKVAKIEQKGRTVSGITSLDKTERIDEVARMIGGIKVGGAARKAAVELMRGSGLRGES